MTISFMRFIDRFVGVPLCWLVGMFCLYRARTRKAAPSNSVSEILVIKFFGIGSIVLATPSLEFLHRIYPRSRITFLSFEVNRELLTRIGTVDEVITIDSRSIIRFIRDSVKTVVHLSTRPCDIVVDFEFFSKFSTVLSGLSTAPIRAAFSLPTRWRTRIVTHSVPLAKHLNVAYSFSRLVSFVSNVPFVGPPVPEPPTITENDRARLFGKLTMATGPIICVNVNAGSTFLERRWPSERFAELISRLAIAEEATFYFTGSDHERDYVQRVIRKTGCVERCVNTAGMLAIPELCALLERSVLLISNDSGPLHLAAALGVSTVGLFGPESPVFYGPLGNQNKSVYRGLPCSPCMNAYSAKSFRCPYDALCMREITVDEVLRFIPTMVEAV